MAAPKRWDGYSTLFPKIFSDQLEDWKKRTGKSQEDFAAECELQMASSISSYKHGRNAPSSDTVAKMCRVLGVDESVFRPESCDIKYRLLDPSGDWRTHWDAAAEQYAMHIGLSPAFARFLLEDTARAGELMRMFQPALSRDITPESSSPFQARNDKGEVQYLPDDALLNIRQLQDDVNDFIAYQLFRWSRRKPLDKFEKLRWIKTEEKRFTDANEEGRK